MRSTTSLLVIGVMIFIAEHLTSTLAASSSSEKEEEKRSLGSLENQVVRGRRSQRSRGFGPPKHAWPVDQPPIVEDRRAFDNLGGGMIPLVDRRVAEASSDENGVDGGGYYQVQGRSFDNLGGGQIPWSKRR